jgi:glutamate:GABA antiporter
MAEGDAGLRRELSLRDVVLFNVAAIVSTRWIAAAAHVGPGSITLWLLAALLFLIPCAFVVAHLSRLFPAEGGLYVWTREAFGEGHGFICAWCYYLNNVFWIPGTLVAFVGMIVYAYDARAAQSSEKGSVVIPAALALLAIIIGANYVGLRVAKWVDNVGGLAAYTIWGMLVLAAIFALVRGGGATEFKLLPEWNLGKLNFWSQLAFGMTGLELCPILSGEIRNPRRSIMRATWISAALVVVFYVFGTAAILVFLQPAKVSPIVGVAGASQQAATVLGWKWLPLAVASCILLSTGGQLGTYVGACARLPFVLGIGNMLPRSFARLHPKYATPHVSVLFLGIATAALLIVSELGESFRAAYQLTVDMTVVTLFIPFLYVFAAAYKFGKKLAAVSGLVVSSLAILLSFVPPEDVQSIWGFELKLGGGCMLLLLAGWLCFRHYQRTAV